MLGIDFNRGRFVILLSWLLLVSGCGYYGHRSQGVSYHIVSGKQIASEYRTFYRALLRKHGVWINRKGETIRLSLPSYIIFRPGTANFTAGSSRYLDDMIALCASYHVDLMNVNAYSSVRDKRAHLVVLALARKRAERLSWYFKQSNQLDVRILASHGHIYSVSSIQASVSQPDELAISFRYEPNWRSFT